MGGFLKNKVYYAIGSIDRIEDGGVGWRRKLAPILKEKFGLKCIDPTNKPAFIGTNECPEERAERKEWKESGRYNLFVPHMKKIRRNDLRFCDICDFSIGKIEPKYQGFGTGEEFSWMNRQKKPVLLFTDTTKSDIADWALAMFPSCHVFGPMDDLVGYLEEVDNSTPESRHHRWYDWSVYDLLNSI